MKGLLRKASLCAFIGITLPSASVLFPQESGNAILANANVPGKAIPLKIELLSVGDKVPDIEFTLLNYPSAKGAFSILRKIGKPVSVFSRVWIAILN